jgi:hypothetical protein
MKNWTLFSISAILLLFALPACVLIETHEPDPTPETFLEEELAAQAIATAKAEKTQTASRVSPYVEISADNQKYLAFWFPWNDETVFLPIAESTMTDSDLLSCRLDPGTELAIGKLFSGLEIVQDECVPDAPAAQNTLPIIKIPGYFDEGINLGESNDAESRDWNIIDLKGEYAENFAQVVTFIVENDLLGSGDLIISIYRMDGPNDDKYGDTSVVPTYILPAQALQVSFSSDQLENFEYVDDVLYALEHAFTWKIPAGFSVLNLSPGDDNWFVLNINESGRELSKAYIQIKGVGAPAAP